MRARGGKCVNFSGPQKTGICKNYIDKTFFVIVNKILLNTHRLSQILHELTH